MIYLELNFYFSFHCNLNCTSRLVLFYHTFFLVKIGSALAYKSTIHVITCRVGGNVCRGKLLRGLSPLLLCPHPAKMICTAASIVFLTSLSLPILGLTSTRSIAPRRPVLWTISIIWMPSLRERPPRTGIK